jgi:hypothetical protein
LASGMTRRVVIEGPSPHQRTTGAFEHCVGASPALPRVVSQQKTPRLAAVRGESGCLIDKAAMHCLHAHPDSGDD